MSNYVAQAAQYYLDVCTEHDRRFPLRNILVAVPAFQEATDKDAFVKAVREWLVADAPRKEDPDGGD